MQIEALGSYMTFRVVPDALDGYAEQLGRAASDAQECERYAKQAAELKPAEGNIWSLVKSKHAKVVGVATAVTASYAAVLVASGKELVAAAGYYRASDAAAAVRADDAMGGIDPADNMMAREWAGLNCIPSFNDIRDPVGRLKSVGEVEYSHPLAFLDGISPSYWALEAFDSVFGFNPLDRVFEWFGGDWENLARTGVMIGNLGQAAYDLGINVEGGALALRSSWEGKAADNADAYFTGRADSLALLRDSFVDISEQFKTISHAIWVACDGVAGFLKGLVDAAIVAGIAMAAGTALSESLVGAVVGYGAAAWEVAQMLKMWAEVTKIVSGLYIVVQASLGLIEFAVGSALMPKLPSSWAGSAYDHPLV